jgi:hypothetical protein
MTDVALHRTRFGTDNDAGWMRRRYRPFDVRVVPPALVFVLVFFGR